MIFCTLIQNDDVRIKRNTLGIIVQKVFCSSKSKIYFSDNRCWASGSFDNFFFYVRLFGNIQSLKVSAIKTQL